MKYNKWITEIESLTYLLRSCTFISPTIDIQLMKQVTINIPNQKYSFFRELIKNLGLQEVQVQEIDVDSDILQSLEDSLREVKLIEEGKIKAISVEELLSEL